MKYELTTLEDLVVNKLHSQSSNTRDNLENWLFIARQQQEVIRMSLTETAFRLSKEKYVKRYIQYHQAGIVYLLNQLLGFINPPAANALYEVSPQTDLINVQKKVYQILEQLLVFINGHFSNYTNPHAYVPNGYKLKSAEKLRESFQISKEKYAASKVDPQLVEIAFDPLQTLLTGTAPRKYTFFELDYLSKITDELTRLELTGDTTQQTNQLVNELCYLNFNSYKFFNFRIEAFSQYIQESESLSDKLERLAFLEKSVSHLRLKPGMYLKYKHHSIKMQFQEWITEEIQFLEKRKQLLSNETENTIGEQQKIRINLSVSQLAYCLRLLTETDTVTNQQTSGLLHFICQHMQTRHTDNISFDSLRAKYYVTEQSTKDAVKDWLIKMINRIRKE